MKSKYDVIVIGSGPAGTATALSLRQHRPDLTVALLEGRAQQSVRVGETLSPNAQPILEHLGVWTSFLAAGHLPAYGTSAAWGSELLYANEYVYSPYGKGWHLNRLDFDAMLTREASHRNVSVWHNTVFTDAMKAGNSWYLYIRANGGTGPVVTLEATFVVDATGRRAVFARTQGSRRELKDRIIGAAVLFSHEGAARAASSYTLIEAQEEGWWYSALLPAAQIVVCFTNSETARRRKLSQSKEWMELLAQTSHTRRQLGSSARISEPTLYPATCSCLDRVVGANWLAVGDAAATLDPLAGQGIFRALRSGIYASYALVDALHGDMTGVTKFACLVRSEYEAHLCTRAAFYSREQRWPQSEFWRMVSK